MNRADWNGNTPLHLAAMWGRGKAMIDFLVHECAANVDDQDENGATALHHAAFNGHKETVVALCNLQAMVNAEDRDGSSPLLLALMQNHSDIARFLKDDKKADIGSFNSRGDTCLWATIQNHNDELMNGLLKASVSYERFSSGLTLVLCRTSAPICRASWATLTLRC